jgi:hypothetical protein
MTERQAEIGLHAVPQVAQVAHPPPSLVASMSQVIAELRPLRQSRLRNAITVARCPGNRISVAVAKSPIRTVYLDKPGLSKS